MWTQLPTLTHKGSDYDLEPQLTVLHDCFAGKIYSPEAAAKLASAALALNASLDAQLGQLWHLLLQIACKDTEHQDKLVDILVDMSQLPDVTRPGDHGQDEPLILHGKQVWKDLPMLDWEIRRHWDYSVPAPGTKKPEERENAISRMVSVNRFLALLIATEEPIFEWGLLFALATLRMALETPWEHMAPGIPWWLWIEVLGAEIYEWDEEYESGRLIGAPGSGGPLWKGKHGFCKGRWKLWRDRFGEAARKEDESEHVRRAAREAELMMKEIETGHVE
ncbi:DUF3632 domain-containing protein [Aspergillus novofumigatus IBT 16806]|uniref:Uncharacterized protein n=1 Tax=Aspergillus novofumigatus (strain IBT 16806) TaxID=1392255 RepID=A0A2I1BUH9_ASPN1|nr:uncharacterized protein P174DRAFT_516219 [Aspergillus novofumigatus IBT 16806]PKX89029.1 hypothetical protein P174DRAFT_516219 [Aspergillus novofumigatus IBT 16806]